MMKNESVGAVVEMAATELSDDQLATVSGGEVGAVSSTAREYYRKELNIADAEGFQSARTASWMYGQ